MKVYCDIHIHNVFSHCCQDSTFSTTALLKKEQELGMRVVGVSNHLWDERVKPVYRWYKHQTIAIAEEAKAALAQAPAGMRVMFGAEADYAACKDLLGMSEEGADHFDYLLFAASHLQMKNFNMFDFPEIVEAREEIRRKLAEQFSFMPEEQINVMADSLTEADIRKIFPELEIDIISFTNQTLINNFKGLMDNETFRRIIRKKPVSIAHPFSGTAGGFGPKQKNLLLSHIPDSTFEECFAKAASLGVNMELGLNSIRTCDENLDTNQLIRAYSIAKRMGCKFTFATDSHSVKDLERIFFAEKVAEKMQLTPSDIAEFVRDGVEA